VAKELAKLAKELTKVKPGSKRWLKLMNKIDEIIGMTDVARDAEVEALWQTEK